MTIVEEEEYLMHYGILRKSGRYPWGSGDNPFQRGGAFLELVDNLKKDGMSDSDIAKYLNATYSEMGVNLSSNDVRATKTIAQQAVKAEKIAQAEKLAATGMSTAAIGREMGIAESSVRSLLAPGVKERNEVLVNTANFLKSQIDEKGVIDIGLGVDATLGISPEKLKAASIYLADLGYKTGTVKQQLVGVDHQQTYKIIYDPEQVTWSEIASGKVPIGSTIGNYTIDAGKTWETVKRPVAIDSKRVGIRYGEDGGGDSDGAIYIRPGVADISLGANNYAQCRILVDGTHYIKGMARYSDDLPAGVDILFNTPKSREVGKFGALKAVKDDPDDPFGSVIRQHTVIDKNGKEVRSAINIVNEEGDWGTWSHNFSSQFLSKQPYRFAEQQLNLTYENHVAQYNTINSLTNPVVRKKLLLDFAETVDSDAVHLQAASLPRTSMRVILPVPSMSDKEVYAPHLNNGEKVVLVRHPHGGTFEIPELTVNNRNKAAIKALGTSPKDAIGINPTVAARLSGADFDGDSVLVIPNNPRPGKTKGQVVSTPALEGLKDFNPSAAYPGYKGMPKMTDKQKQSEMGKISNLITDMTIQGAPASKIARAEKHAMVVIDAQKHDLNYKQSAIDNGIALLKKEYQGSAISGASTIVSKSTSTAIVPERTDGFRINKETGKKEFTETGRTISETKIKVPRLDGNGEQLYSKTGKPLTSTVSRTVYTEKDGKQYYVNSDRAKVYGPFEREVTTRLRVQNSKKGAETDDAFTLTSGYKHGTDGAAIERVYATHSNKLKGLANQARKEAVNTKTAIYSPSANKTYAAEVARLDSQLAAVNKNRPLERQAQVVARQLVSARRKSNPDMDNDTLKKVESKALKEARKRTGADKIKVTITDREWEAIQAGALSSKKLSDVLKHSDPDRIRELAMPRTATVATKAVMSRARSLLSMGYSQAEVAASLGIPESTLSSALNR